MKKISPLVIIFVSIMMTSCVPIVATNGYYNRYYDSEGVYVNPYLSYRHNEYRYRHYRHVPSYTFHRYDRFGSYERHHSYDERHYNWRHRRYHDRDRDRFDYRGHNRRNLWKSHRHHR